MFMFVDDSSTMLSYLAMASKCNSYVRVEQQNPVGPVGTIVEYFSEKR